MSSLFKHVNEVTASSLVSESHPEVTIGIPVFNGENYLSFAIESVLNQTHTDIRLLISDNNSTDSTQDICQKYSKLDSRVTYFRQSDNIGGAPNYNFVFNQCKSPYFKWLAHDDVMMPEYIERCLKILKENPYLSVVHCKTTRIDSSGSQTGNYDHEIRLDGSTSSERFRRMLWANYFNEVFGLMRKDMVVRTCLHRSHVASDRNFMAHLLLFGDVGYVEDYLFMRRAHAECFVASHAGKDNHSKLLWFDPNVRNAKLRSKFSGLTKFFYYLTSIFDSPISFKEKNMCIFYLFEWSYLRFCQYAFGEEDYGLNMRQKLGI